MSRDEPTPSSNHILPASHARAFTQGVGTIFQFVGVIMFLVFFFTCCFSGLLSKDVAMRTSLSATGWGSYTAQRAVSVCMVVGVVLGMALAGIGLGLQAQHRHAPTLATLACAIAAIFWLMHFIFFMQLLRSVVMMLVAGVLSILFVALLLLSIVSLREMHRHIATQANG